jgi:hypothetical protein
MLCEDGFETLNMCKWKAHRPMLLRTLHTFDAWYSKSSQSRIRAKLTACLTRKLVGCLVDYLADFYGWLVKEVSEYLTDWTEFCFVFVSGWLPKRLPEHVTDWTCCLLTVWLTADWLNDYINAWLSEWLVNDAWMPDRLTSLLFDWLVEVTDGGWDF